MNKQMHLRLGFRTASFIMSWVILLIGILVVYGWIFNIAFLKSIFFNFIPMKPNSALIFILIGISLLLQYFSHAKYSSFNSIVGKCLGVFIALFGLLTLLEYLLGYDLQIDQLIIKDNLLFETFYGPGRIAPLSALSFFIIGIALTLLGIKRLIYINQILSLLVGFIGLLILTALTFYSDNKLSLFTYTYASLHSSWCFILTSLALLFMLPTIGIMKLFTSKSSGGIAARRLIPIVILVPLTLNYLRIIGIEYNIFQPSTGSALFSILVTAILIIITFFISKMLMKSDVKRSKMELELRHSNHALKDLYNNAPCGYHSLDAQGTILNMNQTELTWLGYSSEEIIGKKITDFVTPLYRHAFYENFPKLKQQGSIRDIDFEMVRKNGETFSVLLNATAVYDENKNFLMTRSMVFDISDRKRMERALQLSEERFRQAMENAPIGMAIVSLQGQLIEVNQALCKLLNYDKHELENMNEKNLSHPDDKETERETITHLINGHVHSNRIEKRYLRKNGEIIWIQLTSSLLRDTLTGIPLYYIMQIEDISERKRSEDTIRQFAYYDSLTNLPNRRLLMDRLNRSIALAKRHQYYLAILFLDLDKFKTVNDTYGHDVGDELLIAVSVRLKSALRDVDTIARLSGDEFIILLNELSSPHEAGIVANKLIENMKNPFLILGHEITLGCSIGIAIYPNDGIEVSDLLKKADYAMYASKQSASNQYRFYLH